MVRSADENKTGIDDGALTRIKTGNPQLDDILGGGFPANSINIVMGEPGSGKTILAERLMFANATDSERPVLFISTLSEPLEKVVRYLQQFTFYDESVLAGAVIYDSLGTELAEHGPDALIPKLKEVIEAYSPKIIVIDSFKAIHDLTTSMPDMRRMLYEVSGILSAYETTAFLVGEYSEDQIPIFPEFAVADGMVALARNKYGSRDERYSRILKLRGSSYAEGLHAFRISDDGLDVFPRLVSPRHAARYDWTADRATTGIDGFDALLDGGLWRGSTTIVEGATGTGKTTFGLQFAANGVRDGEASLYINFQENPTQLARAFENLGADLGELQQRGLHLFYHSAVELQVDSILVELFHIIRDKKIKRVVIDAVGDLMSATNDIERLRSYLYALVQHFVVGGVTSILTYETSSIVSVDARFSAIADTVVKLDLNVDEENSRRTIRIIKARGLAHDLAMHEMHITGDGIKIT